MAKQFPHIIGQEAEIFFHGKWVRGKIVAGYRFEDGIVTIVTSDGQKIWCSEDRTDLYKPVIERSEE